MLMRESDELKIQKCVDNELSSQETSELLRSLDALTDGWKTLACGLLEDRRIRSVLSPSTPAASSPPKSQRAGLQSPQTTSPSFSTEDGQPLIVKSADDRRVINVNDVVRHWWSHPVTSLSLCAAIAFVSGLLIPDLDSGRSTASSTRTGLGASAPSPQYPLAATDDTQQYRVELQPGGRSVEIPVVTDLRQLHNLDRRHPIFSKANGSARNVQWMVVPVEGNKSMLIPVSEDASADMQ